MGYNSAFQLIVGKGLEAAEFLFLIPSNFLAGLMWQVWEWPGP